MQVTTFPIVHEVVMGLILNITLVVLNVIIVALRFIARMVAGSRLGWDDYLMLAALPQVIGIVVCQGLFAQAGIGRSFTEIYVNVDYINLLFLPYNVLYNLCALTVKLSVLIFYHRVFTSRKMRLATQITIAWVTVWGLANVVQGVLVCHFNNGVWSPLVIRACPGYNPSQAASGMFNFIANVIISLLPIYTIWSLGKVSISTRCYLSAVFLFSLIVTIVSVIHIVLSLNNSITGDPTSIISSILVFVTLEANLGIAINSLPMLIPLYSYWRYRKVWGHAQDEYVSRLRGDTAKPGEPKQRSAVEDIVSGIPLEKIYGVDHIHFTVEVGRGSSHMSSREDSEDPEAWDMDSVRRLSRHAQPSGIQIETTWSITEEQTKGESLFSTVKDDDKRSFK